MIGRSRLGVFYSRAIIFLTRLGKEDLAFQFSPMTCKVILDWRSDPWNLLKRDLRDDGSSLTSDLIVAKLNSLRSRTNA